MFRFEYVYGTHKTNSDSSRYFSKYLSFEMIFTFFVNIGQ